MQQRENIGHAPQRQHPAALFSLTTHSSFIAFSGHSMQVPMSVTAAAAAHGRTVISVGPHQRLNNAERCLL